MYKREEVEVTKNKHASQKGIYDTGGDYYKEGMAIAIKRTLEITIYMYM